MNNTEKYLIDVLRCFANSTGEEKLNMENVDLNALFTLSKQQSVVGIVSYVLLFAKALADKPMKEDFAREYDRTLMQMLSREVSAAKLCEKLSRMRIPHILFKGMTVSEVYPVAQLRAFGDVDIIIKEEDVDTVCGFMVEDGYESVITNEKVVHSFKRGREKYEFHTALNVSNIQDTEYFCNLWENTIPRQGETRQFNHNFHLSYLICHLEKHVYGSGAGIRMYLDIALYIKKNKEYLDMDFVRKTLTECGLGKFLDSVLYVCHRWFDSQIPEWVTPMEDEVYAQMCDFVFSGGVFGEQDKEDIMQDDLRRELSSGRKGAKLRFLMSRVFPPVSDLCSMYPQFENKPLKALRVWFHHVGNVLRKQKLSNVKVIMSADTDSAARKKEFLERIGSHR